jgi:hypothetical protein
MNLKEDAVIVISIFIVVMLLIAAVSYIGYERWSAVP